MIRLSVLILYLGAAGLSKGGIVDPDATPETKALFHNLQEFSEQQVMFGHQHTTCYGIGWEGGDSNRSDVKTLTGTHAAVYGWDMGHTGTDHMDQLIIDAFERGGINTISWHMGNLATGGRNKDVIPGSVAAVLPGGKHHRRLQRELDKFAEFATSLKDSNGRLVPIIFRPWHEHTGGWFWWGSSSCSEKEFIALWQFTVTYLRDTRGVHNLLYAISPSGRFFNTKEEYLEKRFPGFDYIDIVGFDHYVKAGEYPQFAERAAIVTRLAREHKKVAALTEFGYRNGLSFCENPRWFMDFLNAMKRTPDALGIAYVLTWRNGNTEHFWVPYPGHANAVDFKRFTKDPATVFEDDLTSMYR